MTVSLTSNLGSSKVELCSIGSIESRPVQVPKGLDSSLEVIANFSAKWPISRQDLIRESSRLNGQSFCELSSEGRIQALFSSRSKEMARSEASLSSPASIQNHALLSDLIQESYSKKAALVQAWNGMATSSFRLTGHMRTEVAFAFWQHYLKEQDLWDIRLDGCWEKLKELAIVRRQFLNLSKSTPDYTKTAHVLATKIHKAIYELSCGDTLLLPAGNAHHLIIFELECDDQDKLHVRMHDKAGYVFVVEHPSQSEKILQSFDLLTLDFDHEDNIQLFVNQVVKSWFSDQEGLKSIWLTHLEKAICLDSIPEFHWGNPQAANDCTLASSAAFLRSWYSKNNLEKAQSISLHLS